MSLVNTIFNSSSSNVGSGGISNSSSSSNSILFLNGVHGQKYWNLNQIQVACLNGSFV
jgi:hypothetical protein